MRSTVIDVKAAQPYHVCIGSHLVPDIAELGSTFRNVGIVYQKSVSTFVADIAAALQSKGTNVHLFAVPDAEAGKTLVVAEELWMSCGNAVLLVQMPSWEWVAVQPLIWLALLRQHGCGE